MQISHNYMYMYLSFFLSLPLSLSHPSRSSQNTRLDSLCHIATAHQLSILHTALCICWGCSRHLAHSLLPTLCPQVHSLHLCLHSFPANRFINTIFLDSIYSISPSVTPLLFLPSIFPSIRVFSNESTLCIRWPNYWSFSFSISSSNEYSGLISFRIDWFGLLAVQGTLTSLL